MIAPVGKWFNLCLGFLFTHTNNDNERRCAMFCYDVAYMCTRREELGRWAVLLFLFFLFRLSSCFPYMLMLTLNRAGIDTIARAHIL